MSESSDRYIKEYSALKADDVATYFDLVGPNKDINRVGQMGGTPLISAIAAKAENIALEMLRRGANPNLGSYIDPEIGIVSALDLAVHRGLSELAIVLHSLGSKSASQLFGPGAVAGFRKGMLEARNENQVAKGGNSARKGGCLPIIAVGLIGVSSLSMYLIRR